MSTKITPKTLKMLILLVMAVVILFSFRFGYTAYMDKTDAVEKESAVLSKKVNELQALIDKEQTFTEDNERFTEEVETIIAGYATAYTPESTIMIMVNLEKYAGVNITSISFGAGSQIFSSTTAPTKVRLGVYAYKYQTSISFSTTYDGIKKCMDFINSYSYKMNVDSVALAYDQTTGNLMGTMLINQYVVLGSGEEAEAPAIGGVDLGTENIFGTGTEQ